MPADPDDQRDDAVDMPCECAEIGISDADAIGRKEGEEREQHDAEKLGRGAHGGGAFRL
jgi:hypothetical protein